MKPITLVNIAAILTTATTLSIVYVLLPSPLWTPITIVCVIGLVLSVGLLFYIPPVFHTNTDRSDARQVAALGPTAAINLLLLCVMSLGFGFALMGHQKLALSFLLLGIGGFFAASLMISAGLKYIGGLSATTANSSKVAIWQLKLQEASSKSMRPETSKALGDIATALRYSPSDPLSPYPKDAMIEESCTKISQALDANSNAALENELLELRRLIKSRDQYLRTVRSQTAS